MIAYVSSLLASIITLATTMALSTITPKTCPTGWYVEGVRPSGYTQCRPVPPAHCGEAVPPDNKPCPHDDRVLPMVIVCTGGAHPITVGDRTVGCQR